ncbi:MAG: hypothetical protein ACI96M_002749 [Candidatus Azotimanducaceae bacterium]|jgi:uncharacterized protein
MNPTTAINRIESLDVVRGFALLGILLLNILGFALPGHLYFSPLDTAGSNLDLAVWAFFDIGAEGAMRCLFSMLFGAGVALFLEPSSARSGKLHYKRTFWLMVFGVVDVYVLMWTGDVLFVYALAGFVLYWVRHVRASRLMVAAIVLIMLMSLQNAVLRFGLEQAREAAQVEPCEASPQILDAAQMWIDFESDNSPSEENIAAELAARTSSYASVFDDTVDGFYATLVFVIPVILFWDALAMMLLGMSLYKFGILQGDRSIIFYRNLMLAGFVVGLSVNMQEAYTAYASGFDLLATFPYGQWTYHIGRLGMAIGWFGLLMLAIKYDVVAGLRRRLAAVGRMALTNYLSHSFICLLLFTGAGLGLAGNFARSELYLFVFTIWAFQLWLSPWWLRRYHYGPVEWVWRGLTYGRFLDNSKTP